MKNIIKNITITGLLVISLGSCTDEFLDTVKLGAVAEESFYTTDNDLIQASVAMYAPMWEYHYNWARSNFGDLSTDDAVDREMLQFQGYYFDSGNFLFTYNWRYNYRGILIANKLIDNVEGVDKPLVEDKELQKRVVAEAKFLRSYYYYDLLKNYGDVPLTTKPLVGEEMNMKRTPAKEVYAQIERDLAIAIVDLPKKSELGSSNMGRVTKGAALALLVKITATQASPGYSGQDFYDAGKYADTKKYAELLFDLGEYSLYQGDYNDIFTEAGENGEGSIFEIQYYTTNKPKAEAVNNNGNFNTFLFMPWYGAGDPYGKYMVTYDLFTAFEDGDPRREASLYNVYEHAFAWDGSSDGLQVRAVHGSFVNRKNWLNKDQYSVTVRNSPVNERVLRLSDMYLLYAEACLSEGGDALGYVNRVRSRARGAGTVPADLISVSLDDIINERRVELCCEANRRHDLVRFGILEKELKTDGYIATAETTPDGSGGYTYTPGPVYNAVDLDESIHIVFPIPLSEVDDTDGLIEQNEGY